MTTFIQFHILTNYPPANLNRDDLGRPKTAIVGGSQRLRISSQSLKRAWRISSVFQEALGDNMGIRTKEIGVRVFQALTSGATLDDVLAGKEGGGKKKKMSESGAKDIAKKIAAVFGAPKKATKDKPNLDLEVEQLVHLNTAEIDAISDLIERARKGEEIKDDDLKLLRKKHSTVDIAMFGRMLADKPQFNVEAAIQVAHAFTVDKVTVEDDYFTAVDDLNRWEEDAGAAHIGVIEFGAGLFYLYICINKDLLIENLDGNADLANKAIKALGEAIATIGPSGKQSTFASRAYASFVLAEKGSKQPRSLAVAFIDPVSGDGNLLTQSIERLIATQENMDKSYGKCAENRYTMNAHTGEGSLTELLKFITE